MKKLLTFISALFLLFPMVASANVTVPWFATSTDPGSITPQPVAGHNPWIVVNGILSTASSTINGPITLDQALTYGGVTLNNAVIGTGNMVLSVSPTLTGTVTFPILRGGSAVTSSLTLEGTSAASPTTAKYILQAASTNSLITTGTRLGIGIGTTTPAYQFESSSSTAPQIVLDDAGATSPWFMRSFNGSFFLGTTSLTTFATSSASDLTIDSNGNLTLAKSLSLPGTLTLSALTGTQCLHEISGVVSGTGSDCGSGGGSQTLAQTLTNGNDANGIAINDAGQISGTNFVSTSTTATSTMSGPFGQGTGLPGTWSNFDYINLTQAYPASVTTGGGFHIDSAVANTGPALEVTVSAGASAAGRGIVFNQTNSADVQDFILASSSAANTTTLDLQGLPTGKGILKCDFTGGPTGYSNGSCISIDVSKADAQGIFIKDGTGTALNIVNSGSSKLFQIDQFGDSTTTGQAEIDSLGANTLTYADSNRTLRSVTLGSGLSLTSGTLSNTGVLSIQQTGGGTAQTGAITFATSTDSFNGLQANETITNVGGAFTFANNITGTLNIAGGGTGTSTGGNTNGVEYYNGTNLTNSSLFNFNGTNVGIGTTTPGYKLTVDGGANVVPVLIAGNAANSGWGLNLINTSTDPGAATNATLCNANSNFNCSTYFTSLFEDSPTFNNGGAYLQPNDGGVYVSDGDAIIAAASSTFNGTGGSVLLQSGGNAFSNIRLFLKGNGNLGFGTSSPTSLLDLTSTSTTAAESLFTLRNLGTKVFDVSTSTNTFFGIGSTSPFYEFSLGNSGSSFAIDSNGNVVTTGAKPTLGTCGTAALSATSTDMRGNIVITGGTPTQCNITFAHVKSDSPICLSGDNSLTIGADVISASTTGVAFGIGATFSGEIRYICSQ